MSEVEGIENVKAIVLKEKTRKKREIFKEVKDEALNETTKDFHYLIE